MSPISSGCGRCFKGQHAPRDSLICGGVGVELVYHTCPSWIGERIKELSVADNNNIAEIEVIALFVIESSYST